jgi:hypothetical protein
VVQYASSKRLLGSERDALAGFVGADPDIAKCLQTVLPPVVMPEIPVTLSIIAGLRIRRKGFFMGEDLLKPES